MVQELLFSITKKDFKITWFSGTGAGGQYRNKHQNCCRIQHIDSGAMATGQSHRSREANQREAIQGLVSQPIFKIWHARKVLEIINNEKLEDIVERQMDSKNIKVEIKDDQGRWIVCPPKLESLGDHT